MSGLLPYEEALARLLDGVLPIGGENLPLQAAAGRYLAEDLIARASHPPFDRSMMDGYALSTNSANEPAWRLVGEAQAGRDHAAALSDGEAVAVSTGARVPAGTICVVPQEAAEREGFGVRLTGDAAMPGRFIRRAGSDFAEGERLAAAGTRITPSLIALAMVAGYASVRVGRQVRVALLQSGDELVKDVHATGASSYPACNGPLIAAMLAPYPAKVRTLPILPDEAGAIASTLAGLAPCDVLATIGGASVGRHDLVRTALQDWGANLRFAGAAIKPGKPVFAAQKGRLAILGLPGNPVSAFVTAHLFLLPLVARLAGSAELFLRAEPGILAAPLPAGGERREFVRARATEQGLCPLLAGDSGALLPLSRATHLVDRPCSAPPAPAGTQVRAFPL